MKLSEQAYNKLKKMILENKFVINQVLLIDDVVQICGVSRTPVREALLKLQADGLIDVNPRHGIVISPLSKKDIMELYELLGYLEVTAIDICITNGLSDSQIEKLESYIVQMEVDLNNDDLIAWSKTDKSFHETMFKYTKNSRLIETAQRYSLQAKRCKDIVLKLRPKPWNSIQEHRLILDTIVEQDILKARKVHLEHWRIISQDFVHFLEQYNLLGN